MSFSPAPSKDFLTSFTRRSLRMLSIVALGGSCAATLGLSGCATGAGVGGNVPGTGTSGRLTIGGAVHGGQQPVANSVITLYAAGKTGTASAARSMLTASVSSDAGGAFSITGLYTCQAGDQVYIVASGGDAGSGGNAAIRMMAALGPCGALQPSTFVNIDEVTTVGAVYALAPYMTSFTNVGSDASMASSDALAASFADTKAMVDNTSGIALETSLGNGIVPQKTIDSLANSLAACVNSAAQNSTTCTDLFSDTTVAGSTPADTLQAALNLAHYPATNSAQVFALASPTPPFEPTLTSAPSSFAIVVAHPSDVLTYHNNNSRNGTQAAETTLTPANVTSAGFGKILTFPVDSYLFAQPLYVGGVGMPDGALHDLVLASSTHATVYAFDADGNNPASGSLWSVSLLPSGERYASASDYGCGNPPESGIVGTPVIDRDTQTIYVVTKTISTASGVFYHRLHAISLLDGSEKPGSPTVIAPTFAGTGAGSTGSTIAFSGEHQSQRSALLLAPNASGGKTVWISYASHCDIGPYHGIVLGYDAASLANNATFIDTPNGSDGGIWMSNGGMNADAQGYIYALAGNGTFSADTNGSDYGDAVLKLTPPAPGAASTAMSLSQFFTPDNQAYLDAHDLDVGGTEGILVADPSSGVAPQVLIASDKNGSVYLLNTANLGGYNNNGQGTNVNGDIQDFTAGGQFIYNFAFFNNVLYTSTQLSAFTFTPGTSTTASSLNPVSASHASITAPPVVSANGLNNGVVWAQEHSGTLHAYTTGTLRELYNTTQAANGRDTPAPYVQFTSPIVANGKVYLSGQGALVVYGLLQ